MTLGKRGHEIKIELPLQPLLMISMWSIPQNPQRCRSPAPRSSPFGSEASLASLSWSSSASRRSGYFCCRPRCKCRSTPWTGRGPSWQRLTEVRRVVTCTPTWVSFHVLDAGGEIHLAGLQSIRRLVADGLEIAGHSSTGYWAPVAIIFGPSCPYGWCRPWMRKYSYHAQVGVVLTVEHQEAWRSAIFAAGSGS